MPAIRHRTARPQAGLPSPVLATAGGALAPAARADDRATAGEPSTPSTGGSWWSRPGRELARRLAERCHARRVARELARLSARELRDIGLDHGVSRLAAASRVPRLLDR